MKPETESVLIVASAFFALAIGIIGDLILK